MLFINDKAQCVQINGMLEKRISRYQIKKCRRAGKEGLYAKNRRKNPFQNPWKSLEELFSQSNNLNQNYLVPVAYPSSISWNRPIIGDYISKLPPETGSLIKKIRNQSMDFTNILISALIPCQKKTMESFITSDNCDIHWFELPAQEKMEYELKSIGIDPQVSYLSEEMKNDLEKAYTHLISAIYEANNAREFLSQQNAQFGT